MEKAFAMNDENINYELKEEENFELIKDMFELNGEYTGDEQNNVELLLDMDKIEKELDSVEIELEDELSEELIISKDDTLEIEVTNLEESLSIDIDYENDDIDASFDMEYDIENNEFYVSSEIVDDNEITTNNFIVDVLSTEGEQFVAVFKDDNTGKEYLYDSTKLEASALPVVAYVIGGIVIRAVVKQIAKKVVKSGLKFTTTTLKRMKYPNRFVPSQILKQATKGKAYKDPRGSKAKMYYTTMYKNGKKYNLEVLYNKKDNKIYHFMYTRKALGPLKAIKK